MRKIRVYLDTSVFGGTGDDEFSEASIRIFKRNRSGKFTLLISQITLDELQDAPEQVKQVLEELPGDSIDFIPASTEAAALAQAYIDANILGKSSMADALHVASATVGEADMILSWNFRHIVNYDRIHKYNGINALHGYPSVEIHSPLEMRYADENENV